jgi:hypothetical protein
MVDLIQAGLILSSIWVFCVYSMFLVKDNPAFRVAEHACLGVAMGNTVVLALKNISDIAITPLMEGKIQWIIPFIVGAVILSRASRRYGWIGIPSIAVLLGIGTALAFRGNIDAYFVAYIRATGSITSLAGTMTPIDNLIVITFTIGAMLPFIFTVEHKGPLRWGARFGRIALMVYFGSQYGNMMMTRMTWLAARMLVLLQTAGLM